MKNPKMEMFLDGLPDHLKEILGHILTCDGCGHFQEKQTIEEYQKDALEATEDLIAKATVMQKYLKEPNRGNQTLVGIVVGTLNMDGEKSSHTFATYGTEDLKDMTVVYQDSRKEGEKEYNVHGIEAAQHVVDSIQKHLFKEYVEAKEKEAKKEAAQTTDDAVGT